MKKTIVEINREKANTQEPPSQPPIATSNQPKEKETQDTTAKVDHTVITTTATKEPAKEQIGQDVPTVQSQGATPQVIIIDQGIIEEDKEEEKSPKEKE